MKWEEELLRNFTARVSIVNVISYDENRVVRALEGLAAGTEWPEGCGLYGWDIADQVSVLPRVPKTFDVNAVATPDTILTMIDQYEGSAVFVLKDFHFVWESKKRPFANSATWRISWQGTAGGKSWLS